MCLRNHTNEKLTYFLKSHHKANQRNTPAMAVGTSSVVLYVNYNWTLKCLQANFTNDTQANSLLDMLQVLDQLSLT